MSPQDTLEARAARPSLREEHKTLTRSRMLDAAVSVFGEKPFLNASIDDIAKVAGVTRATVYAHFPGGKGDLVRALVTRVYSSTDEAYDELAAVAEWTRAGLRRWLEDLTVRWRELTPTVKVLTTAGLSIARASDDGSQRRYLDTREHHVRVLAADPLRWRSVPEPEARQRVLLSVLQIESFLLVWLTGGWSAGGDSADGDPLDPLDLLTDAVCHLLAPALRG